MFHLMCAAIQLSFYGITFYCYIFTFMIVFALNLLFLTFKKKGDFIKFSQKFSNYLFLYLCYKSAIILEEPYIYKSYSDSGLENNIISLLLFLHLVALSFFKLISQDFLRFFNYKATIIISSICGLLSSLLRLNPSLYQLMEATILRAFHIILMDYVLSDWLFSESYIDTMQFALSLV